MTALLIDSDNAMGSPSGNVDDGFAIAAILASDVPVAAITSIGGNTAEALAYENNVTLARLFRFDGVILHGAGLPGERETPAARFLASADRPLEILALGPLTNVAAAMEAGSRAIRGVTLVGSNPSSRGRWPPHWPHEANLTWDREATRTVFESGIPLRVVPLDVVGRLRAGERELAQLPGEAGAYLREQSERWLRHVRRRRLRRSFRLADLVAAMWCVEPAMFHAIDAKARAHPNGWVEYGTGGRPVKLLHDFDTHRVWQQFVERLPG